MRKKWIFPSAVDQEARSELAEYSPVIQQVLFSRGMVTSHSAGSFLSDQVFSRDPLLLSHMHVAIERIEQAVRGKERIAIYGDYDVDGVSATALLIEVIEAVGGNVIGYIPNRYDEGYGLNIEALRLLQAEGIGLVVSVDCGVRSSVEADLCREIGLDLIITDHHMPQDELPIATALINPKQPGDEYPFKELAGVGLAYKIAQALVDRFPETNIRVEQWLDFVALGTVADVVPLVDENRWMVKRGMELLKRSSRPGIQALKNVSGVTAENFTSFSIGFLMAPRLNAAGRLESALDALHLLLEKDYAKAGALASQLDRQNRERQDLTRVIQDSVEASISTKEIPYILFASNESFLQGVVGLAASRLVERFYRPSIVAFKGETLTKASCRSIPEFHITRALDECADLLVRHGGHSMAAGFTVENSKADALVKKLEEIASRDLAAAELIPRLRIDAAVKFSDLNVSLMDEVERFQPTGSGNPEPLFAVLNVKVIEKRTMGKDGAHLRLKLAEGGKVMDAVCFRMGDRFTELEDFVDVAFNLEKDYFHGAQFDLGKKTYRLQLNVRDIVPAAQAK